MSVVGKSRLIAEPPRARVWSFIPKRQWKTVDARNLVMTSPHVPPYVRAFFPGRGKQKRIHPLSPREFCFLLFQKALEMIHCPECYRLLQHVLTVPGFLMRGIIIE